MAHMGPWWRCLVVTLVLVGAGVALALAARGPAEYRVATEDMRLISAPFRDTRRPNVSDPKITLRQQKRAFAGDEARQVHVVRDVADMRPPTRQGAVYIPALGGPGSLYVNNVEIARTDTTGQVLEAVPERLYLPGLNRVDVRIESDRERSGSGPIYIGPFEPLNVAATRRARLLALVNVLSFPVLIIALVSAVGVMFTRERLTQAAGLSLAVMAIVIELTQVGAGFGPWRLPLGWGLLLGGSVLAGIPWTTPGTIVQCFSRGAAGALAVAGLAGLLWSLSPIWGNVSEVLSISQPLVSVVSLGILGVLLLAGAIQAARQRLADAQARIAQQAQTITAQQRELEAAIRRSAVIEERQRFTRDMHDGIGGQLTSLLIRVRSGRADLDTVEHDIRSGLADLRNMVDSLDHVGDDLESALNTFRSRAEQQVKASGLEFGWRQGDALAGVRLRTRQILHVYRLLQEALNNALRHSGAGRVDFTVAVEADTIRFSVRDDGEGFRAGEVRAGRGLRSLRERAAKLGADLVIDSAPGQGTRVDLAVPLSVVDASGSSVPGGAGIDPIGAPAE